MTDDTTSTNPVPEINPADERWERPVSKRATTRATTTRRRTTTRKTDADAAETKSDVAETAETTAAPAKKTTTASRAKAAPVPRDVPVEWSPTVESEPDAEPAAAKTSARATRTTRPAAAKTAAARVSKVADDKEVTLAAPAAQPSKPVPAVEAVAVPAPAIAAAQNERGDNGNNTDSASESPRQPSEAAQANASRPDNRNDGRRNDQNNPNSQGSSGERNNRNDNKRERFNRNDRQQRDNRNQQPRQEFRRLSRQEMRRLSRRERMMLRQQEDPYDPQAGSDTSAPRPDAPPPIRMSTLQALDVPPLLAQAEELGIVDELTSLGKHDIIFELLRHHARRGGTVIGEGILELRTDGFGYLRNPYADYSTCPEDPCVLPAIVRRFGLRAGDYVVGPTRPPNDQKNRVFTVVNVEEVNGMTPAEARRITPFESLTPTFPDRRIDLEVGQEEVAMRVTNIFTPIGFGQRGLIVAPPRTGKTVLLQKIANSISANHPNVHLIILLIDERPEEVTDMQRNTKAHVFSSTFDEPPERHVQVADAVIEKSRRLVELGKDVVILLDSITRLARAYNTLQPNSGKILSGGVDANALQKPKRFFGAARNIEGGGSLTIIATALVDTGSRMDEVIFEEFKGTGNMELCLDRSLVDKRVFPAINIEKSGTRKEELLLHSEELARTWILRRALSGVPAVDAMEMIVKRLKTTGTNAEFLMSMKE